MGGATGERAEQAARTFRSTQPVPDSHTTANTSIPIIIHAVQSALMLPLKMAPAIAPGERALLVAAPRLPAGERAFVWERRPAPAGGGPRACRGAPTAATPRLGRCRAGGNERAPAAL